MLSCEVGLDDSWTKPLTELVAVNKLGVATTGSTIDHMSSSHLHNQIVWV